MKRKLIKKFSSHKITAVASVLPLPITPVQQQQKPLRVRSDAPDKDYPCLAKMVFRKATSVNVTFC